MSFRKSSINDWMIKPHDLWNNQWLLLTSGDYAGGHFNTMTVAWGSFGTMWKKPFAQIVVRPSRYTWEFTEKYDTFTLCAFPERYRPALQLLGSKSGRDSDKIAQSGLTPIASDKVAAPGFDEAELIVECRKIYYDDFKPQNFISDDIEKQYPLKDYHRLYFGEIETIREKSSGYGMA
jgi:flavin reductase (DIM6/NTAB) family NADH-FMN oxidoreductase RutF